MFKRIIIAFLVSPLLTGMVFIVMGSFQGGSPTRFDEILIMFLICSFFAYISAVILGIPAFLILRALKLDNVLMYALAGAIIGALSCAFWFQHYALVPTGAIAGAVSGSAFWLIIADKLNMAQGAEANNKE